MLKETKTRSLQLLITGYENHVVSFDGITIDLVCSSVIMKLLIFHQKIFNYVMLYQMNKLLENGLKLFTQNYYQPIILHLKGKLFPRNQVLNNSQHQNSSCSLKNNDWFQRKTSIFLVDRKQQDFPRYNIPPFAPKGIIQNQILRYQGTIFLTSNSLLNQ